MSARPKQCKVPSNVWFANQQMADANCARKQTQTGYEWFSWRCYDHYHIKPRRPR